MKHDAERVLQVCQTCGSCSEVCSFLAETDESPGEMAIRGIRVEEAFSCSLCGRCEAACPLGLRPAELFAARRAAAIAGGEVDSHEYSYLFPDCEDSIMSLYRQYYRIDYSDIEAGASAETCFFPGCTLMTYSPGLTREVYSRLKIGYGCQGLFMDCCGKPLNQMGLLERADRAERSLIAKVAQKGVKRLVVACPGCYYHLREVLKRTEIAVLTIYEALEFTENTPKDAVLCTVHDSCPDRFGGIYAGQVRGALQKCGYQLVEMSHSGKDAPCCGSGGQISHFRPDLAEKLVEERLEEARKSGAGMLVAYCLSCVLNFARKPSSIRVRHALNLLLEYDEDYAGVKERVNQMYIEPVD